MRAAPARLRRARAMLRGKAPRRVPRQSGIASAPELG